MQTINRQALAERIHANAVAKGFWPTNEDGTYKYSPEHYGMLVITELSEAVEAHRKNNHACRESYDDKLYKHGEANRNEFFWNYIKDSVEDELADAYIRLLDLSAGYGVRLLERFVSGISHKDETFTERILRAVGCVLGGYYSQALDRIEDLSEDLGIDLLWHIEEKMRYNESRPPLHGKEY